MLVADSDTEPFDAGEPAEFGCDEQPSARLSVVPATLSAAERSRLQHVVDHAVVPRLARSSKRKPAPSLAKFGRLEARLCAERADQEIRAIARLLIGGDIGTAYDRVVDLRAGGVPVAAIFQDVLGPVASHLGELWANDLCGFSDCTFGLAGLQSLLRRVGQDAQNEEAAPVRTAPILLAVLPGDPHIFALSLLEEMLRFAGLPTVVLYASTEQELLDAVARTSFGMLGLSVSCQAIEADLKALIGRLRSRSRNKAMRVMVGGPYFVERSERVGAVGADLFSADAAGAVRSIEALYAGSLQATAA